MDQIIDWNKHNHPLSSPKYTKKREIKMGQKISFKTIYETLMKEEKSCICKILSIGPKQHKMVHQFKSNQIIMQIHKEPQKN